MSIGIMDADISAYTLVPFNLEVMKLAAYYRKNKEIVILAPSFTPGRHQKFFYRKDYNDGNFPVGLLNTKNIEYGGLAFSNNVYQPLPLEIERQRPDATIYQKMEKIILSTANPQRKKIFQNMMEAEHCRLSLDGKTIWEDYTRQFSNLKQARNLMFHDYDLGAIEGSFEEVTRLLARARTDGWATRVGMKFPVQVSNGQDLLNWASLRSNSTFYSLRYNGVMENDAFLEWVCRCHEKANYSQMEYYVTPSWYTENDFIEHLLQKIFRQIIISRTHRVYFPLIYDEKFFSAKRWCRLLHLFNCFQNSFSSGPEAGFYNIVSEDTLFDFARKTQKKTFSTYGDEAVSRQEARELFAFVREKNYSLFKDFYECNARSLGGKL